MVLRIPSQRATHLSTKISSLQTSGFQSPSISLRTRSVSSIPLPLVYVSTPPPLKKRFLLASSKTALTALLVIAFPIWLLWGVRISMRRRIALGAIFSLVGFTIVATILRGALLTQVFQQTATGRTLNYPWIWFWFHMELCICKFDQVFVPVFPGSTRKLAASYS